MQHEKTVVQYATQNKQVCASREDSFTSAFIMTSISCCIEAPTTTETRTTRVTTTEVPTTAAQPTTTEEVTTTVVTTTTEATTTETTTVQRTTGRDSAHFEIGLTKYRTEQVVDCSEQ